MVYFGYIGNIIISPWFWKVDKLLLIHVPQGSNILNSKRNANVCSDPVQSHYDEKLIHDNRSTSQNEIRAKCSLDICLSNCTVWYSLYTFLHTPPVSKTANVKTWLTFIQSNIANFICISFAVQYILRAFTLHRPDRVAFVYEHTKLNFLALY